MSKVLFSISARSLTFYVNGRPYSIDRDNPSWSALKELVQSDNPDVDEMIRLTEPVHAITNAVEAAVAANYLPRGTVSVSRTEVRYNGELIGGALVERIFDMLSEGFDIMPMVRFLENLMTNPADFARDELYLWLENSDLPITDDGHFLAYKLVNANFTSIHDGRTMNEPGTVVEMPRTAVDPVRDHTCSTGLHFCSKSYLPSFGYTRNGDQVVVLLKINPADVVSIPSDYNNAKGRAWKYEVIEALDFDPTEYTWPSSVWSYSGDVEDDDFPLDDDPEVEYLTEPISPFADLMEDELFELTEVELTEEEDGDILGDALFDFLAGFVLSITGEDFDGDLPPGRPQTPEEIDAEFPAADPAGAEAGSGVVPWPGDLPDADPSDEPDDATLSEIARQSAISDMGIIALRRATRKWKGHSSDELRTILVESGYNPAA